MSARILVAGIGNLFLSDDGFGPEVVRRLTAERLGDQARLVDYGIRGMHLVYDLLDGYDVLILVDALPAGDAPGTVTVLAVTEADLPVSADLDAHDMNPVAVLVGLRNLGGTLPATYVVGARPAELGEGIGLSPAMEAAVPVAMQRVTELVTELVAEHVGLAGARDGGR